MPLSKKKMLSVFKSRARNAWQRVRSNPASVALIAWFVGDSVLWWFTRRTIEAWLFDHIINIDDKMIESVLHYGPPIAFLGIGLWLLSRPYHPASTEVADFAIKDLFNYLHPLPFADPTEERTIGKTVIDKLSTGELTAWGRRIHGSARLALTDIPRAQWERAQFTYWFLLDDRNAMHVECFDGTQKIEYADLMVNERQAKAISWPAVT